MSLSRSMPALVALGLSALASPALAEDGKTMPAGACQPNTESRGFNFFRGLGSISNLGDSQEAVLCPVVKDLSKIKRAAVMLIDRNPDLNADIFCTLFSLRSDGTIKSESSKRTNGSFTLALPLSFDAQGAAANGSYDLVCSLPRFHPTFGASTIYNYTVVEE